MKKQKLIILGYAVLIAATASGCTTSNADTTASAVYEENNVPAGSDQSADEKADEKTDEKTDATTVQVSSIDGNTISAKMGELKTMDMEPGKKNHDQDKKAPDGKAPRGEAQGDGAPGDGTPGDGAPGDGAPGDGAPGDGTPGDGAPGDGAPGDGAPGDGAPGDGAPGNGALGDGAPGNGAPGDGAPGNGAPGDGAPGGSHHGGFGGNRFEASGNNIVFTVSEDTVITVEYLQGSGAGTIEDIVVGSVLEVTLDSSNQAQEILVKNLNAGGGFGGSGEVTNGTSANTISENSSVTGETYSSSGDNENALRVDGASVSFSDITIEKTGGSSSNTEDGDFYGQNAGFLALNGADVTIANAVVNTSAANGNGIFSYGEGTTVHISDSTIRTTENNSGGIQTTGGGTTNAENLDVETQGNSSAAIRSDRGGGTVHVDGGTYITNGTGSPAIYCTADISVSNAVLTANASEGIVVEGKNSVSLTNCHVSSSMSNTYHGDSDENIHGIMIYQSMSGDAEVGEAYFSAENGSITTKTGDLFYITNTDCEITLKNVSLQLANEIFLRVEGNSSSRGWGTQGANGGDVILTTDNQKLDGNILVDSISSLNLTMKNESVLNGAINPDGAGGTVNVVLESGSTWNLSEDSYITSFTGDIADITSNGYHLYVNGGQVL